MRACVIAASWMLETSGNAMASTISYHGTLADANSVYLNTISVLSLANADFQTYGYGGTSSAPGGTNAGGAVILPGGFDPVVAVFGPDGTFIDQNDDGDCPLGSIDGGNCFDSTLHLFSLSPGVYAFALTVAGNYAAGAHLTDGFTGGGDFFDRTSAFAIDVTIQPVTDIPEPRSMMLCLAGSALLRLSEYAARIVVASC